MAFEGYQLRCLGVVGSYQYQRVGVGVGEFVRFTIPGGDTPYPNCIVKPEAGSARCREE